MASEPDNRSTLRRLADAIRDQSLRDFPSAPRPAASPESGSLAREEARYLDKTQSQWQLEDLGNTVRARNKLAWWSFALVVSWLFLVLLTVWGAGIVLTTPPWYPSFLPKVIAFEVGESVLITLVTTTTANVLGLLVIVFKYLYPPHS